MFFSILKLGSAISDKKEDRNRVQGAMSCTSSSLLVPKKMPEVLLYVREVAHSLKDAATRYNVPAVFSARHKLVGAVPS